MSLKKILVEKIGVDKAILYTILGRSLQISTSLFTVFFIAKYLSPEEQGYYYTFGSLVAIQVFFELGLTGIITKFFAHEFSHLIIKEDGEIEGEFHYKSRLSSLYQICVKWYSYISFGLLIVLIIAGYLFFTYFSDNDVTISWILPWLLLCLGTVLNFVITPITAFIEGLGKVKDIARFRLVQQCIQPLILWGGLYFGAKLYVPGLDAITKFIIIASLIYRSPIKNILGTIFRNVIIDRVSYVKEVFPYQWRIAISWISGYFIFQLFNPVLFATEGPVVAGQMGMSMQALNALQALTLAWINTKVPLMSGFIALNNYKELDSLFYKTMKQLILIGTGALLLFDLIIFVLQYYNICIFGMSIGNRFLPILPLLLMSWAVFTMFPINCWATYLRCHKQEPLLLSSVVVGVLCCISTITLGYLYGLYGITIGLAILRFLSLTWIHSIYKNKKNEWHNNE